MIARTGAGALVVAGGVRAVIPATGEARLAEQDFAGRIVDVVRREDGSFLFRDALGTLASSGGFLGRLRRRVSTSGPALHFRGPSSEHFAWFGGDVSALEVPARTRDAAFASERAGLALVDGGLLYRTQDGGRSWGLLASGANVGAPHAGFGGRVRVRLGGRVHALDGAGTLQEAAEDEPLEPLHPDERRRLLATLTDRRPATEAAPWTPIALPPPLADGRVIAVSDAAAWVVVDREPVAVVRPTSPCPSTDPFWLTYGASAVYDVTPYRLDLREQRATPLCAEQTEAMRATHLLRRGDDGFLIIGEDETGTHHVSLIESDATCADPRALPRGAVGACFTDARRGVAWGRARATELWHTRDGGGSWSPLPLGVDGDGSLLSGASTDAFVVEPNGCTLGARVVVRWSGPAPELVMAPSTERTRDLVGQRPDACPPPPTRALHCSADGTGDGAASNDRISVQCDDRECRGRVRAWPFSLRTPGCTPNAEPHLQLEALAPQGALISCATDGTECPCASPGYWVDRDGVTALPVDASETEEALAMNDGSVVFRRSVGFGTEEVVRFLGDRVLSRRDFSWAFPWPRGLMIDDGVPLLAVVTPHGRALDRFDTSTADGPRDHAAIRYDEPARACGAADAHRTLIHSEVSPMGVVWHGAGFRGGIARIGVRVSSDETPCLAYATLIGDDGEARLFPAGARSLSGRATSSDGSRTVRCTLRPDPTEEETTP